LYAWQISKWFNYTASTDKKILSQNCKYYNNAFFSGTNIPYIALSGSHSGIDSSQPKMVWKALFRGMNFISIAEEPLLY